MQGEIALSDGYCAQGMDRVSPWAGESEGRGESLVVCCTCLSQEFRVA